MTTTLRILFFLLAVNSNLALSAFAKFMDRAGLGFFQTFEMVHIPLVEWTVVLVLSALMVLGLSIFKRASAVSLFVCLSLIGILVLVRRLLECSLTGSAEVFDIIYIDQKASLFDCALYTLINTMMMFIKITYTIGIFFLLKSVWNWLVKDRFPRAVLD